MQFRGEPYLIAGPAARTLVVRGGDRRARRAVHAARSSHRRRCWRRSAAPFTRFEDARMWDIAKAAMPDVPIRDAVWLQEYDAYYYDKNRARPLPVLRVRYADEAGTWLYLDPSRGTMTGRTATGGGTAGSTTGSTASISRSCAYSGRSGTSSSSC